MNNINSEKMYAVSGIFDNPNDIINAASKVTKEGYTNYDVHTPYPVHGMDDAMDLEPSKIGYLTILLGLTGLFLITSFIYWVNTIDYPQVIGGKPFFSLPAYVPLMFEVTVLLGAVGTVASLLIFFLKFPNNSHPLHDTNYIKQVSSNKFGIVIETNDPKFDLEYIKNLFNSLGASKVEEIYHDLETLNFKPQVLDKKFIGGLIVVAIFTSFSAYMHLNKLLYITPFDWMTVQTKLNAQSQNVTFKDGFGMRQPVEGSIARGFIPYQFKDNQAEAAINLVNPIEISERNLEIGKKKFLTFCSPCHGNLGDGASRLRGQFPVGPTLHSDKVRNWTDGDLYHVITVGQNVMPGYERLITRDERWSIVLYIRSLQRAFNAKEEDLK
jgi:mono/diheme cytochrome c family protein